MELEFKSLDRSAAVVTDVDEDGTFEAIVAVTNIKDDVGDIIKAGAFTKSLKKRTPKGISAHDWKTPIARTIEIKELPPGDPWIKAHAPDIAAKGGGVLYVKGRYVLGTQAGSEARVLHQEFKEDLAWSIGYGVPAGAAKHVRGVRELKELDVHEYSQVIVGAMPLARGISVKSAVTDPAQLETKRHFSEAERDKAADSGAALPDGSFPIYNAEDLGNAISLAHNAKNVARAKRHIKKRAAALGLTGKLPDDWKSATPDELETKAGLTLKQRDGRFYMVPAGTEDDADLDEVAIETFDSEAAAVDALREELADERESRDDIDEDDPLGDEDAPPHAYEGDTKDVSTGSAPAATGRGFGQGPLGALHQFRPRTDDPRRCRFCDEGVDGGMHVELDAEEEKALLHPFIGDPDVDSCEACGQIKGYELFAIHSGLEVKARGGHDRNRGNAETLRRYWTVGAGGQRIRWGVPGDFMRCVTLVSKHMSRRRAKGYCALRHKETTGHWTGDRDNHGGKSLYLEGGLAPDGVTDDEYRDLVREQEEAEAAGGVFDPPMLEDPDEEKAFDAAIDGLEEKGLRVNGDESRLLRAAMRAEAAVLGINEFKARWGVDGDTMAPSTDDGGAMAHEEKGRNWDPKKHPRNPANGRFIEKLSAGRFGRIDIPEGPVGGPPLLGDPDVRKQIGYREGVAGGEIRAGDFIDDGPSLARVTRVDRTGGFGDEADVTFEGAEGPTTRRVSSVYPANIARPDDEDAVFNRQEWLAQNMPGPDNDVDGTPDGPDAEAAELSEAFDAFLDDPDAETYFALVQSASESQDPEVRRKLRAADDLANDEGWVLPDDYPGDGDGADPSGPRPPHVRETNFANDVLWDDAGDDVTSAEDDGGPTIWGKIPEIARHEDDLMSVARRNGGNVKPARAAAHIRMRAREEGGSRESAMRRVADAIEGRGKVGPTDIHWLKMDRWSKHQHSAYDAPLGIALADYIDYDTGGLDFTHLDELMLALPPVTGGGRASGFKDLQDLMDEQKSLEATLGDD